MARRFPIFTATLCLAALQLGAKCVDYDDRFAVPGDETPGDDGGNVLAHTRCPDPNEAQLSVEEYAFIVRCGCAEPPGIYTEDDKRCTVSAGTKVTWVFAGSLQHNVSSTGFSESRPRTTGRHSVVFDTPGRFDYSCSLHVGQMSGYSVIVR